MNRNNVIALSIVMLALIPSTSSAQDAVVEESRQITPDIELDPIAFALGGYSLHAGIGYDRFRVDLGAFALEMPEVFHGNEGFDVGFNGFGMKLDVFLRRDQLGPFAGIEGSYNRLNIAEQASGESRRVRRGQAGVRVGWRIGLPADFFVTPWVGVGYTIGAADEQIAGRTFEENPLVVFPTVHLGRRFR